MRTNKWLNTATGWEKDKRDTRTATEGLDMGRLHSQRLDNGSWWASGRQTRPPYWLTTAKGDGGGSGVGNGLGAMGNRL